MSITAETAAQHANDPAVLCCRAEEGLVIGFFDINNILHQNIN